MIKRKFRRGDVISIRAVVQHTVDDDDESVHVKVGGYSRCSADFSEIISFIQPAVELDDVVWFSDDRERRGIVKAAVESGGETFLLVETDPGRMEMWMASHIEVVPPLPPAKND